MKGLCILLGVGAAVFGGASLQDGVYTLADGKPCPLEGSAINPRLKELNRAKNRFTAPTADDIDTDVSLAAMLAPGEDELRFDQARAARVVGFVVNVKAGGKETCNCRATDPIDRDTHIELALSPDAPRNQRVIVEVTPRIRKRMKEKPQSPADWQTLTLQSHGPQGVKGKWVEVTGWLFFDAEHTDAAENSSPGNPGNWRATCWEVHPVTDIQVLGGPPESLPTLPPNTLRLMQHAHAQQLLRDKPRKDAIESRNKESRDRFGPEEGSSDRPK